jgi:hypothetical protein
VPNTKVVAIIQIYLHAKFHIFLRSISIFPIFISLLLIFQFGKGIKYWKKNHGSFPSSRPGSIALLAQPISPNWPHRFLPQVAAKRAPVPRGPRVLASLLHGREQLRKLPCLCPLGWGNPCPSSALRCWSSPAEILNGLLPMCRHLHVSSMLVTPLSPRDIVSCVDTLWRHITATPPALLPPSLR